MIREVAEEVAEENGYLEHICQITLAQMAVPIHVDAYSG